MKKKNRKAGGDRKRSRTWAYPVEFRLRIVKLFLCATSLILAQIPI
jgi:hypothetical protein